MWLIGSNPAAVAGASADGADLHVVGDAESHAFDWDCAGVREKSRSLPGAGCAAGGDFGDAHFVGLRVFQDFHSQDQAAAIPLSLKKLAPPELWAAGGALKI